MRNLVSQKSKIFDLTSLLKTALLGGFVSILRGAGREYCAQSNRIRINHDLELSGLVERIFVAILDNSHAIACESVNLTRFVYSTVDKAYVAFKSTLSLVLGM